MPKGNLSYNSYTACVRDAKANGVSVKNCSELARGRGGNNAAMGNNSNMGRAAGNAVYNPGQPGGPNYQNPNVELGWGGMNNPGSSTPGYPNSSGNNMPMPQARNLRRTKPGQNLPVQPGGPGRRPGSNQVMSGQGPAGMAPRNVVGPPTQAGPRPLNKRRRRPRPNPGPMPSNFRGYR